MNDDIEEFPELNSLFAAARKAGVKPSDALMARVLADADAVQAGFQTTATPPMRASRMQQLFRVLGGWPSIGGLVAATVTGIWIGVNPPSGLSVGVSEVTQAYLGIDDAIYLVDIAPGSEFDLGEEAL